MTEYNAWVVAVGLFREFETVEKAQFYIDSIGCGVLYTNRDRAYEEYECLMLPENE